MFRAVSGMFVTPMIASSIYIEKDNFSKLFLFVFLGSEAPRIVGKKFRFLMFHDKISPTPCGVGAWCVPLYRHFDGNLFLLRNSLRELGEVICFGVSLGQVLENRLTHAPCVLKLPALDFAG